MKTMETQYSSMFRAHMTNYSPYFFTITFNNMKTNYPSDVYNRYFTHFHKKLCSHVLTNSKDVKHSPIMYLYPEAQPAQHYHGLIMIHKKREQYFKNKAFVNPMAIIEYHEKLKKDVRCHQFKDVLLNPYPLHEKDHIVYSQQATQLKHNSHKIYELDGEADVDRALLYSMKNIRHSEYSIDDIIFLSADKAEYKAYKAKKSELIKHNAMIMKQENFAYEKIQD